MTHSLTASAMAGAFVLFGKSIPLLLYDQIRSSRSFINFSDVGMLILNQYILLDPILLFFISGATYAMAKFRNMGSSPFSVSWWTWLGLSGVFLGGAISVKFVGLFVILLVGFNTIDQLWEILGDISKPISYFMKHFLARAACLIALPIVIYVALFYVHLKVLYKS